MTQASLCTGPTALALQTELYLKWSPDVHGSGVLALDAPTSGSCTFSSPPFVPCQGQLAWGGEVGWGEASAQQAHLALRFRPPLPESPAVLSILSPVHASWMEKVPLLDPWLGLPACTTIASQRSESIAPAQTCCKCGQQSPGGCSRRVFPLSGERREEPRF